MSVKGHGFGDPGAARSVFVRDFEQFQSYLAHARMD
jgi:hypothetical protein